MKNRLFILGLSVAAAFTLVLVTFASAQSIARHNEAGKSAASVPPMAGSKARRDSGVSRTPILE